MIEATELLKKVRKLEIVTSKLVDDVVGGAYHSVFKGSGIEFDEVREYTFEDDVRDIDWNVSARLNAPYVKKYVEERELNVLLMLDISGSMAFGASGRKISERAVEAAALLGLSAIGNHDRVGLSLFSGSIDKFFAPRGGRHNNLRLIRELISAAENSQSKTTNIAQALRYACGVLVKRSVIFVVSDLIDNSPELAAALKIANRRHDVIVLHVYDPESCKLPRGMKNIYDSESGQFIQLSSRELKAYSEQLEKLPAERQNFCRQCGVEVISLPCDASIVAALMNFFKHRRNRRSNHHAS